MDLCLRIVLVYYYTLLEFGSLGQNFCIHVINRTECFLMAGGKSADPKVFNDNEVYSTTRITIAPLLIIAGFLIEIFAIMKKPTASQK